MEQLAFLRSEVLNLTETIKEIKSAQPPSNEPLEEAKKRTLLSEYEKILSQKDNENAVEDKNQLSTEEEEIIKQVIKGLTKSLNDEEEILKQVTLNLQSIMKEK
jgi:FixJ family two-component response regulator